MDIESVLQRPCEEIVATLPLASQLFLFKGEATTLTLFPDKFTIDSKTFFQTFQVQLYTKFEIIEDALNPECSLLKIFTQDGQILELEKECWGDFSREQWEEQMLMVMNRCNFHDFFIPIKKIGTGNFACVYLAETKKNQTKVAIKVFTKALIEKTKNGPQGLFNEIQMMRKASCSNIAKLYGVYETENSLYMIQEYAQGKTLARILNKTNQLSYRHRKSIMAGLMSALTCMQSLGIVHRDIKPQNILYNGTEDSLKLVDFGLATEVNLSKYIYTRCGTPGHVAPEIISLRNSHSARFYTASDVFSAGTIFFHLIFGKVLFDGVDNTQILERNGDCNLSQVLTAEMKESVNAQEYDLLYRMLEVRPERRIKASKTLEHPYLAQTSMALGNSNRQIPSMKDCLGSKAGFLGDSSFKIQVQQPLRKSKRLSKA